MDTMRVGEIAKVLGITRERVWQIARGDRTFPKPVETEPYRRWDRPEVGRWATEHWWGARPWRQPPTDSQAG